MSNPGQPVFTKHHIPPFTWTTSEWRENALWCMVSFELAGVATKTRVGYGMDREFCIGRYRLRVAAIHLQNEALDCVRVSSPTEESIRGAWLFVREIVSSAWNYYFGKKSLPEHISFVD